MKKIAILFIIFGLPALTFAQNEYEIKKHIENSLGEFFSLLSYLNDDELPTTASTIASDFKGEHYFRLNGRESDFESFLARYSKSDLNNNFVNHTLHINTNSIKKTTTDASDRRWSVNGTLSRENATGEDYIIKDENISFVVRFNGVDKQVSILDLNFSTPLNVVRPQMRREYQFEVDRRNSNLTVPYSGGEWKVSLVSKYRDVKYYPGISGRETYGEYFASPFEYESTKGLNITLNENPPYLKGQLRGNYSKEPRYFNLTLRQQGNPQPLPVSITQYKKDKYNFFDFDDFDQYFQLDVLYSLKYNFGLSGLYTFEDSRFSIGALIATNFDTFRAMEKLDLVKVSATASVTIGNYESEITNGYKKSSYTDYPGSTSYSDIMDPFDEAKHYTRRSLFLVQGGIAVNQWMSFSLGIGAAYAKGLHYMNTAYSRSFYSYEKQDMSLPDIPDEIVYKPVYKNYYYKDSSKWGFALRPALNFQIPVGDDLDIALGSGYTIVAGLDDANSLDFSLGLRWNF